MPIHSKRARAVVVFVACLASASCFEEPVMENLRLAFQAQGQVTVTTTTTIADIDKGDKNLGLARRLAEVRSALERGQDPWGSRFAMLSPARERIVWERADGKLVRVERSAEVEDMEALRRFLADANLALVLAVYESEFDLEIVPGASGRATRSQRDRVDRLLGAWSEAVARTLEQTATVYAFIDDHPESAPACLAAIFDNALGASDRERAGDPPAAIAPAIEALKSSRSDVLEIFDVPADEAYSVNELSHLVYDPFPARFTLTVTGEILRAEGFARSADGTLSVAGLGLFEALEALGGRWADPDPIVEYVRAMRARGDRTLPLDGLVGRNRRAVVENAAGIRAALETYLHPSPSYHVLWRLPSAPPRD